MTGRVLVAGIGNIFLSDDGFGVAVAQRLAGDSMPDHVTVMDAGIRGVHLAYELLNDYELAILVDTMPLGEPPGTLRLVEPDLAVVDPAPPDAHRMDPQAVFAYLSTLGGTGARVMLIGCQPMDVMEGIGLSPPVEAAVDKAAQLVRELINEAVAGRSLERSA